MLGKNNLTLRGVSTHARISYLTSGLGGFRSLAAAIFPFPIDTSIPEYRHKRYVISLRLWRKLPWYKKAYYKLRSWVKRDYFICNGQSDNKEINRALRSLPKNPGGAVYLLEGDYLLAAAVVLLTRTALLGNGKGTRLYTTTAGINLVESIGTAGTHKEGVLLAQMFLEGTNTGNGNGLKFEWTDHYKILNLWIENNGNSGMFIDDADYGIIYAVATYHNGYDAGQRCGLYVVGSPYVIIALCIFREDYDFGIKIQGAGGNTIGLNIVIGNDTYPTGGIELNGTNDAVVVGNSVHLNGSIDGIRLTNVSYCVVVGNIVYHAGRDGIRIDSDANTNIINSNRCFDCTGWGINFQTNDCDYNVCVGNGLRGNTAGSLFETVGCAGNEIAHNVV